MVYLFSEHRGDAAGEYAGNYIYENNTLQFFNTSEGYVSVENTNSFSYVYNFKDHLSNVRLSYTDANEDGQITQNEIIKESNYYPFGLSHKGYNNGVSSLGNSVAKRYMFGGKELNEELGLDWYDITARNYDAALGRWFVIDALADEPEQIFRSPYQYAWNNPVYYNDPDGNCPKCRSFFRGVRNGFVNTFKSVGNAIANPVETVKQAFNDFKEDPLKAGTEMALNVATGGLYGGLKKDAQLASDLANGNFESAGENVGESAANLTIAVATARVVKGVKVRASGTSKTTKLYRGVNSESPAFKNAQKGSASPRRGNATPAEHNAGNTNSNFTSWTKNPEVAKNFALRKNGNGVVLEANISKNSTVTSPSVKSVNLKQSPGTVVNEAEVLVKGNVKNAKVTQVSQ